MPISVIYRLPKPNKDFINMFYVLDFLGGIIPNFDVILIYMCVAQLIS